LETRRTPRPVSGCNKPEDLDAEQAVEVVRNHEDGTRSGGWHRRTEGRRKRRPGVDAARGTGGGVFKVKLRRGGPKNGRVGRHFGVDTDEWRRDQRKRGVSGGD